jgi:hypothetical protein
MTMIVIVMTVGMGLSLMEVMHEFLAVGRVY